MLYIYIYHIFLFNLEPVNGSLFIYLLAKHAKWIYSAQSETNTLIMVAISPKLPLGK